VEEMKGLELVKQTRKYVDYIEEHLNNVWKAFLEINKKCESMRFIYDDYCYHTLRAMVLSHDLSKFSAKEFTQYRDCFVPLKGQKDKKLGSAWDHHKASNDHHWQNWTKSNNNHPYYQEICCAHMVIDWLAMSYKFGDTPRKYYEDHVAEIHIPDWSVTFIYEIFDALEAPYPEAEKSV
jgi:hypothetical protein